MSLNLNPVSIGVREKFRPFQDSVAYPITRYLPFGTPARYLSLGACDIRKIFYTIYSEKGNGHERKFDLTFCEQEPAILARTLMFLRILLDGKFDSEDERYSIAWNVYHDVGLGEKAVTAIQCGSALLLTLSESMESWSTSQFGQVFRIVNVETLQACRDIWKLYQKHTTSPATHHRVLNKALQTICTYERHWNLSPEAFFPPLTSSFGIRSIKSLPVVIHHMRHWWICGIVDPTDMQNENERSLNPMFSYTRSAGEKFVVERNTSPLSIYHLCEAINGSDSSDEILDASITYAKVVEMAKSQFRDWCAAFREFVGFDIAPSENIVFRFVAADPITFCLAVQQAHSQSPAGFTGLSDTWSGTPLVVERDTVPAQFNTIDASTLVDFIGCINILMAAVPLLQPGASSTLTTESYDRPFSEELCLLPNLLCFQPTLMYALFGIAPLGYLSGVSTTGLAQDSLALIDNAGPRPAPVQAQIVWKSTWAADSAVTHLPKISFDKPMHTPLSRPTHQSEGLIGFLSAISAGMLSRVSEIPARANEFGALYRRLYIPAAFAAFVAFLKTRASGNLDKLLQQFCDVPNPHEGLEGNLPDMVLQLHLRGAFTLPRFAKDERAQRIPDASQTAKVFTLTDRPRATCVVLTVPREKLEAVYDKVFRRGEATCSFEIRHTPSETGKSSPYFSLLPIFGKLVVDEDGLTGRIEADKAHWHGTSDLQVCIYLPTHNLCLPVSKADRITFGMYRELATVDAFRLEYGKDLVIFDALLSDPAHVHCLKSLAGFEQPVAPTILLPEREEKPEDEDVLRRRITPRRIVIHRLKQVNPGDIQCDFTENTDEGKVVEETSDDEDDWEDEESVYAEDCSDDEAPIILLNHDRGSFSTHLYPIASNLPIHEWGQHNPIIVNGEMTPCSLTVSYGRFRETLQFPLPVVVSKATFNELSPFPIFGFNVPICDAKTFAGGYHDTPIPLVRDTGAVCSWTLPHINFATLPPLKDIELGLLIMLYLQTYSDNENRCQPLNSTLWEFKQTLFKVFMHHDRPAHFPRVVGLCNGGQTRFLFFVTGVFMDEASHSVVAEAFCLERPSKRAAPTNLDVQEYDISSEELEFWKQYIPAMVERCRSWTHKPDCSYSVGANLTHLCCCGKGLTSPHFDAQPKWTEFSAQVVRCAISPIFPAPFIEASRTATLHMAGDVFVKPPPGGPDGCSRCGAKGKLKKCAKCSKAFYCNKECQKADWKVHKRACQAVEGGRRVRQA